MNKRAAALALLCAIVLPSIAYARSGLCVVDDPTPTPLNVRTKPYGAVLTTITNGRHVYVIDHTDDRGGRAWVYVADEGGDPIGWVYRDYIKCF